MLPILRGERGVWAGPQEQFLRALNRGIVSPVRIPPPPMQLPPISSFTPPPFPPFPLFSPFFVRFD